MQVGSEPVLDGNQIEEMTGAVELGLFAGGVVVALGRVLRDGSVTAEDRTVLKQGQELLEALRLPENAFGPEAGLHRLGLGGTGLDVLSAIEAEAANADVEEFLEPLTEALKESLMGNAADHVKELEVLHRVFISIGDFEVARVSNLSQPGPPSSPPWQISPATSSS
jgi:hypothetical protein